jgi:hypothetical protein
MRRCRRPQHGRRQRHGLSLALALPDAACCGKRSSDRWTARPTAWAVDVSTSRRNTTPALCGAVIAARALLAIHETAAAGSTSARIRACALLAHRGAI